MGQENNTIDNEIIDIKPLIQLLNNGLKNLLKGTLSVITFYKKKVVLFGALVILGVIGGYFLDKQLKTDKVYKQEILIQPKYEIGNYLYGFVKSLKHNLKDSLFLKTIKLDKKLSENLKKVEIVPVFQAVDVLEGLHLKYGDNDAFHHIIDDYGNQKLEEDQYKTFFKHHKLIFYFKSKSQENLKISKTIFDYIKANTYYNDVLTLKISQAKVNLQKNKETLDFVEKYLAKLNENSTISKEKEIVFFAKDSDIPTIASLLERKERLQEIINKQEETVVLDKELIKVVDYNGIILQTVSISKRLIFLLPILLFSSMSIIFLVINIFKNISNIK